MIGREVTDGTGEKGAFKAPFFYPGRRDRHAALALTFSYPPFAKPGTVKGWTKMGVERHSDFDQETRGAERRPVMIGVRIRRSGEPWFQSQVADLSMRGFRLQSFMKLLVGSELWVMLPGFEARRARVQWTRGHEAGCVFERPLHPAILDHIVAVGQKQSGG